MKFRLGTRKSALALRQALFVQNALENQGCPTELISIDSDGDEQADIPLYKVQMETPGLFTKRLEQALIEKKIDLAVHSFKDLPTQQPESLEVVAVTARESVSDCVLSLIGKQDSSVFLGLPKKSKVGTSSLRRQAQLSAVRPDLNLVSLRGNVPTRLEALKSRKVDAIVLAEAGLNRLDLDLKGVLKQTLPVDKFVPAPAQGALAIESRKDCPENLRKALLFLNDDIAKVCTQIERTIMRELEGGCTLPLGVYCEKKGQNYILFAFLGEQDGALWSNFHRFDFQSPCEQTLISKTVEFFRREKRCPEQKR